MRHAGLRSADVGARRSHEGSRVNGVGKSLGQHVRAGGCGAGDGGRCAEAGDVLQGCRADSPGQVPGLPSAELDRADVAHHLPGGASLGAVDPGAREHASDAAVAHRPVGRRPEVQERHVAQRRADRHHRPLGRRRGAAGRSEGPAAAPSRCVTDNEWQAREGRLRPARSGHQVAGVHDAGRAPGRLVAADERHSRSPSRAGSRWSRFVRPTWRAARSSTTRSPIWS